MTRESRVAWALAVVFVASEVAANWLAAAYKLQWGSMLVPSGALLIPVSMLVRDALHLRGARTPMVVALLVGAAVSAAFSYQVARIALASVLAFTVSFAVDAVVFSRLAARSTTTRMRLSNWASLPVDTLVFVPVAFYGLFPIGQLIAGQVVVKLGMTELAIVALRLWRR